MPLCEVFCTGLRASDHTDCEARPNIVPQLHVEHSAGTQWDSCCAGQLDLLGTPAKPCTERWPTPDI